MSGKNGGTLTKTYPSAHLSTTDITRNGPAVRQAAKLLIHGTALKTKINLKCVKRFISHRTVNTFLLHYINQLVTVVCGKDRCLF